MTLPVVIHDGLGTGNLASVHQFKDKGGGLIVATRPYNYYEFKRYTFSHPTYGQNMNIGAAYGASPELVHNGIDSTLWTGSTIAGTAPTFNNTARAYEGTRSILWDNPTAGSIFQVDKGSAMLLNNSVAITMWINIDANYEVLDLVSFYAWSTTTGAIVGTKVYLNDYVVVGNNDVWQKVTISLKDMNIAGSTITSFRFYNEVRNGAKSPTLYIDKIQIEATADELGEFVVQAEPQTWFFCSEATLYMADVYNPTIVNSSCFTLDYKKFLNEPMLDSGINVLVKRRDTVRYNLNFKNLGQFIQYGGRVVNMGYDGSSETWLTLSLPFETPILLQGDLEERVIININDNLSGLTQFTATARGAIEYLVDNNKGVKHVY